MRPTSPTLSRSITDNVTRREFIIGGTTLAALIAAGCSDDTPASTPDTTSVDDSRTVAGVLGNTYTFDAPPARVFGDLDLLASLGVVPVGSELYDSSEWATYQQAVLDPSTTTVRYTDGPNFEAIAATRPDLILTAFADETYHQTLADIAPTIFVDNTKPWRDVLRDAAVPLLREVEAERAIGEVELAFEQFREANPDRVGTTPGAIVINPDGTVTVMTAESSLNAVLTEAGFAPLPRSGDQYGDSVSDELLSQEVVGDFLMVFIGEWQLSDPDEPIPAPVQERLDSPLFASLPAAQGGVHVFPDEGYRAAYYFTPLYLPTWISHLGDTFA
jgi:ABC-type Fe3+-hydroxamate transport system substrate-binding protein